MSDLQIRVATGFRSMSDARPAIERALAAGEGMIRSRWEGDELLLEGPGALARVTWDDGHLIGRASLSPPASLFAAAIEDQFTAVLREAAGDAEEGPS